MDGKFKLEWDKIGERFYETGVDRGVLYPMQDGGEYGKGVAWNGLTGITESPSGAEASPVYADNLKYLNLVSAEEFGMTIEAYTYPDEFGRCLGECEAAEGVSISQQARKQFGVCYRTKIGNDTNGTELGYKLHLVYNCLAGVSDKGYATVNESPEAMTLSWEVTTTPVDVPGFKATACLVIDSTKAKPEKLEALEKILYGYDTTEAKLPTPSEVIGMMKTTAA